MNTLLTAGFGALAGAVLIFGTLGLIASWRLTRRLRRIEELQVKAASNDVPISLLVTAISRLEARLHTLEHAPARESPPPATVSGDRTYRLARSMASNGADARRIADSCDIAIGEAELLARVQAGAGNRASEASA